MKCFTKDWYNKMQNTNLHLLLKIDERCKNFSEELYNELYDENKRKYLETMSFYGDFDSFSKLLSRIDKSFNELPIDEQRKKYLDFKDEHLNGESFDKSVDVAVKRMKESLPIEILNEVSDIRVLGLGYATSDIYNKIKEFCEDNMKFVNEKMLEYSNYVNKEFKDDELEFLSINLHDAYVVSSMEKDNDLEVFVDDLPEEYENKTILFKNCEVVVADGSLEDARWLYDEVYKIEDKLEIHILISSAEGLKEFIMMCDEVYFK